MRFGEDAVWVTLEKDLKARSTEDRALFNHVESALKHTPPPSPGRRSPLPPIPENDESRKRKERPFSNQGIRTPNVNHPPPPRSMQSRVEASSSFNEADQDQLYPPPSPPTSHFPPSTSGILSTHNPIQMPTYPPMAHPPHSIPSRGLTSSLALAPPPAPPVPPKISVTWYETRLREMTYRVPGNFEIFGWTVTRGKDHKVSIDLLHIDLRVEVFKLLHYALMDNQRKKVFEEHSIAIVMCVGVWAKGRVKTGVSAWADGRYACPTCQRAHRPCMQVNLSARTCAILPIKDDESLAMGGLAVEHYAKPPFKQY